MSKQGKWYEDGSRRSGVTLYCRVSPLVLTVTNQHIDHPGHWIGSCHGLFQGRRLKTPGATEYAQDAQDELMNDVITELNRLASALSGIRPLKVGE